MKHAVHERLRASATATPSRIRDLILVYSPLICFGRFANTSSRSLRACGETLADRSGLFVKRLQSRLAIRIQAGNLVCSFLQRCFGLFELLQLFENLRLERGDLFAGSVCLANCRRVLVLLFRRHQVSFCSLGPASLFDDFVFEPRAGVFCLIATAFQRPNFKGALIELSFDLGAPFRYRLLVCF